MPHQFGKYVSADALHNLTGRETVAHRICGHGLADDQGDTEEAITDSKLAPRLPIRIQEQFALPALRHEPGDDFQRYALQVDHALHPLALRLLGGKHDALILQLDVAGLNMPDLLRAGSRIPSEHEPVAEGVGIGQQRENLLVVLGRHVDFAALALGLFGFLNGVAFGISHLLSPIIYPLDGRNAVAGMRGPPGGLAVDPFHHMVGFHGGCGVFGVVA